jgi:hypothetical protein
MSRTIIKAETTMPPIFYTAVPRRGVPNSTRWAVELFSSKFPPTAHIFVEFKIPGGRQVDFLLLTPTGAYCIEAKKKSYVDVKVNAEWSLRTYDGRITLEPLHNGTENPYNQAIETSNSVAKWIARNVGLLTLAQRLSRKDFDVRGCLRSFDVFPAVIIPAAPEGRLEKDTRCWIHTAAVTFEEVTSRRWTDPRYGLTELDIQALAKELGLKKTAPEQLLIPLDIQYCTELVEQINRRAPLLDYYIPNRVIATPQCIGAPKDPEDSSTTDSLLGSDSVGVKLLFFCRGGLGKTTLCLYYARRYATLRITYPNQPVPVILALRQYRHADGGIRHLLEQLLRPAGYERDDIEGAMQDGGLFIFLDGVARPARLRRRPGSTSRRAASTSGSSARPS